MRSRVLIVPALLFTLLVGGCGGSSTGSTTAAGTSSSSSSSSMAGSSSSSMSPPSSTVGTSSTSCPTSNSKSFAKTRFVTDLGGALFLMKRYVLAPYQAGKFTKGATGRTFALVKAGAAVATSTKLLKNAQSNAKANPTLCKTVSGPLTKLTSGLGGLVSGLKSGSLSGGAVSGISGLLGSVKSGATKAGVPVTEQQVPLG